MRGGGPGFLELLEILDEAVTIRAPDDTIIYANKAARQDMGYDSLEDLRARSPRALMDDYLVTDEHGRTLHLEDLPSVKLLRGEPAEPLLLRAVDRATGEVRWRLLKAGVLRDVDGEMLAAVTVIENVTAVKMAELRTRVLAESGQLLVSSLDYQQTLRNVAQVAVPALADWCIVDLVDDNLRRENVVTAHRDPQRRALAARLRERATTDFDPGGALRRVLRTGTSELYPSISDAQLQQVAADEPQLQLLRELHMRSVAIVPMRVPGRILGVMTLVTAESLRRLDGEDLALAEQLAGRAAAAVENARLHTALLDVAATLQRSLLPDEPPEVPGWEIAALYRPAGSETSVDVGGDFYELFDTDEGWCALIGDVAGKGIRAAAMTSLMRHGARFASRAEPQPSAILGRLNEFLRQRPGDALCTVLCAQLAGNRVVLSSAGHPPAMIVSANGEVREAPASGPLLGAFADPQWPEQQLSVDRELILLYTDGVTETAGSSERFGVARLRGLMSAHANATPQELLAAVDTAVREFSAGPQRDDIAALALRPARTAG
ncbi:MAG TPA: SpoIIE family protein phosphatase [Solirubrobacteraceae bacterium]|nr:SpoIIE family protein phosphatase [Solirubrobacteraceae bacterium]